MDAAIAYAAGEVDAQVVNQAPVHGLAEQEGVVGNVAVFAQG